MKQPSERYKKLQKHVEANPVGRGSYAYKNMMQMFAASFRLKRSTFREDKIKNAFQFTGSMDHLELFQHANGGMVLVTQPYHRGFNERKRLLGMGVIIVDLNEWAFYYPGHAFCFGLVFNRENFIGNRRDQLTCKLWDRRRKNEIFQIRHREPCQDV